MGVGLLSMEERAAELGGSCRVRPRSGGGTLVRAVLPTRAGAETLDQSVGETGTSEEIRARRVGLGVGPDEAG